MERFFIEEIWNYIISQLDKVPDDIFAPEHVQKARLKCEKLMRSRFEPESTVCKLRDVTSEPHSAISQSELSSQHSIADPSFRFLCTISCVEISFIKITCSIAEYRMDGFFIKEIWNYYYQPIG